ncbi:MAG: phenylalanine--tRNA ligase subunit beta [Rickettsiales bacterium]
MKFPLSLLLHYLTTDASLAQISTTLTAIGLEVDGIEDKSAELKPFVVAEILHAEKHPQADKLQVCKVKAAQGELQIVCGAPNARAGIKVALANIGTIIPTNGMEIKAAKVRGVESQGMLCSGAELGLSTDSAGIMELPLDAVIGTSIVDVLGLGDPVLDINVTANRGDCMGVIGIARDLAAAGLGTFTAHPAHMFAAGAETYPIRIDDREACPAFVGRIIRGVKNGPSPEWIQRILTAAGMRPISLLVDVTNLSTLADGRPAHVYDLKKLTGGIVVRAAKDGETVLALNDKTYTLTPRDCVIADDSGVIGIGGIMGGKSTAVDESTTDILLEIALFDPERIAKTGRALQIDSDARSRFERGVDTAALSALEEHLAGFIVKIAGGNAGAATLVGEILKRKIEVPYSAAAVNALGGVDVPERRQREILTALGFRDHGDHMHPPSWRHDISQPADLAEEVLRIVGYDAIPLASLPKPTTISRPALDSGQVRASALRRAAAARGLHETYSWGFCSKEQADAWSMGCEHLEALELLNPISADLSVMRPKIMPHLIDAVKNNLARGVKDIAIFELGAVFEDVTPAGQKTMLSGIRCGSSTGTHWAGSEAVDVFDVKADLYALLDVAGINTAQLTVIPAKDVPWLHPGRSGFVGLGPKNILGVFAELHPGMLKQFGVDVPAYAFTLFVSSLPALKTTKRKALNTSDFQTVSRDFAFVVDGNLASSELVRAVSAADKSLLRDVTIFDVYTGKNVAEGKKSIALTVTLQADDRTLTDAEIEAVATAILTSVKKVGAVVR